MSDNVIEYLAKFAEEENAGRVSYHGSKSEKALGVWTDIADVLDYSFTSQQVRACVSAISKAIDDAVREEREVCAKAAGNALGYAGVPCGQAAAAIRRRSQS